jgi:dihydroceramidase
MQLLDELSMIYCSCVAFYAVFSPGLSPSDARYLLVFVVSLAIFISGYYHFLQDPVFHQTMFAILTAIVAFKNMYTMEMKLRPSRQPRKGSTTPPYSLKPPFPTHGEMPGRSSDDRARESLKQMWLMVACGIGTIGLGFLVWNLDTIYCSKVRRWRRKIGLPWGILLEGHAWWYARPIPSRRVIC